DQGPDRTASVPARSGGRRVLRPAARAHPRRAPPVPHPPDTRPGHREELISMSALRRISDGVIFQAVLTGSLSFSHIHDLAAAHGQAGWKAWLYPLSVDLLTVAAYRKLTAARSNGAPSALAWCSFLLGLGASLAANIAGAWQNPDRLTA